MSEITLDFLGETSPLKDNKYPLLYKNTRIISTVSENIYCPKSKENQNFLASNMIFYKTRPGHIGGATRSSRRSFFGFLLSFK